MKMTVPVDTLLKTSEGRGLLRAQHTCIRQTSSMACLACNRGVPYPAATVDEILDEVRDTRPAGSTPGQSGEISQPGKTRADSTPRPHTAACPKCGYNSDAAVVGRYSFLIKRDPPSLNRRLVNTLTGGHRYRREKATWMFEIRAIRLAKRVPYAYRAATDRSSWPVAEGKRRITIARLYSGRQKQRDVDNLAGGMKPVVDAMVAEGLLRDDSPEYAEIYYQQRRTAEESAGLWFEIEILGGST